MKLYRLFNKKVFHIQPDLERIKNALSEIGNPHETFHSILISGTNGKGSTAVYLESLLRHHGLKTGLFISPHVLEENERWQINRKNIENDKLDRYIFEIQDLIKKYNLTYFEASALLAFRYFSEENVDTAVLEVGLGGRWDATNVVYPEVSVITNVSLDHTHILGDSLTQIAREKLGIARKDRPLVIGTDQMEIISQAVMKGIKEIYHYPIGFTYQIRNGSMEYIFRNRKIKDIRTSVPGDRQLSNAATAITAFLIYAEKKGIEIDENKIKKSILESFIPGRMQIVKEEPLMIVDGAHNLEAIMKTFEEIKRLYPDRKILTLFSGMKDKDLRNIISTIKAGSEDLIITRIPVSRSITEETISEFKGLVFVPDIEEALNRILEKADENTVILITGSLYLAGEVLKKLR
ncbi:bifunctional folylpolyglutamate synthase/dihydrofolate synthase [Persephonella sp.]